MLHPVHPCSQSRPMARISRFVRPLLGAGLLAAGAADAARDEVYICPYLDAPHIAWREIDLGYVAPAPVDGAGWKDTAAVEARIHGMLFYWENDWGGDLEARVACDLTTLQGFDGSTSSYSFAMARLTVQWSQRFIGGFGLRIDASPGLYAALREAGNDGWAVPFGLSVVRHFGPHFAVLAGASIQPGFSHEVDPRFGLRWRFDDDVLIDLAYPASQLRLRVFDALHLTAGAQVHLWPEYSMGNDPRERVRFTGARVWGGAELRVGETLAITLNAGYAFQRTLRFQDGETPDVELGDAPFFRAGLSWLY